MRRIALRLGPGPSSILTLRRMPPCSGLESCFYCWFGCRLSDFRKHTQSQCEMRERALNPASIDQKPNIEKKCMVFLRSDKSILVFLDLLFPSLKMLRKNQIK